MFSRTKCSFKDVVDFLYFDVLNADWRGRYCDALASYWRGDVDYARSVGRISYCCWMLQLAGSGVAARLHALLRADTSSSACWHDCVDN